MKCILTTLGFVAIAGASAQASIISHGWEITVLAGGNSGSVAVDNPADPADSPLQIQKSVQFTSVSPFFVQFRQVADDANTASTIEIADEVINNLTGLNWNDFEMFLLNEGEVTFDQAASAGFGFAPFTTMTFLDASTVRFADGIVPDGGVWTPGLGSGSLVFHVDLSADGPVIFNLKELPSIPAPSMAGIGAVTGLLAARRRR